MATENSPKADYVLVEIDTNHLTATAFGIGFMLWRRETLAAPFSRAVSTVAALAKSTGKKVDVCQLIEAEAVPPDSDARRAFLDLLQLGQVAHSSLVHDGTGFKAASVRAIVNLQLLLSKPAFPHLLFSSVREAAVWHARMQAKLGRELDTARFEHVARELRALHRERFP